MVPFLMRLFPYSGNPNYGGKPHDEAVEVYPPPVDYCSNNLGQTVTIMYLVQLREWVLSNLDRRIVSLSFNGSRYVIVHEAGDTDTDHPQHSDDVG